MLKFKKKKIEDITLRYSMLFRACALIRQIDVHMDEQWFSKIHPKQVLASIRSVLFQYDTNLSNLGEKANKQKLNFS